MAGSYHHAVDKTTGKLLQPHHLLASAAETPSDTFETIEEMYGMIWWLAEALVGELGFELGESIPNKLAHFVELARKNYQDGLAASPGVDGRVI